MKKYINNNRGIGLPLILLFIFIILLTIIISTNTFSSRLFYTQYNKISIAMDAGVKAATKQYEKTDENFELVADGYSKKNGQIHINSILKLNPDKAIAEFDNLLRLNTKWLKDEQILPYIVLRVIINPLKDEGYELIICDSSYAKKTYYIVKNEYLARYTSMGLTYTANTDDEQISALETIINQNLTGVSIDISGKRSIVNKIDKTPHFIAVLQNMPSLYSKKDISLYTMQGAKIIR